MELEEPLNPPTAQDVARRLILLKYVSSFAFSYPEPEELEEHLGSLSPKEKKEFEKECEVLRDGFWQEVKDAGLWDDLTPFEKELAAQTPFTVTEEQQQEAGWKVECIPVLQWALGVKSLIPPFLSEFDEGLFESLPEADDTEFIESATLRDREEIEKMAAVTDLYLVRARLEEGRLAGNPLPTNEEFAALGLSDYDAIIQYIVVGAQVSGLISVLVDGDLPVNGKAFRTLDEEERTEIQNVTTERYCAFAWLLGLAEDNSWDAAHSLD